MSFVSGAFVIFFAAVMLITLFIDRFLNRRVREYFLLAASYFFYGYWDWRFCFLLMFVTITAYYTAKACKKKSAYLIGIVSPIVVLAVFKYLNFFLDSVSIIIGKELGSLAIILPVGISFYTFQAISYVVDVKRGAIPVEEDFVKLALYISFFPQLVAGPIVRAADFLPQLQEDRKISWENIKSGIQIICFGFFKKLVIADRLATFVDGVFKAPSAYSWQTLILALLACVIQIYMDFSGYSDIAIGCAYCMGYSFKKNFNLPFIAQSFTEFWNRWHISMSGWFTEYVFYPLAGKLKKRYLQLLAILFTMFLSGLWHGASWNMVLWGCMLGLMLVVEKLVHLKPVKCLPVKLLRMLYVFILNTLFISFFRSGDLKSALSYLKLIFTLHEGINYMYIWTFVAIVLCLIGYTCAIIRSKRKKQRMTESFYPIFNLNTVGGLTLFFLFCGLILVFAATNENPFIYFQF